MDIPLVEKEELATYHFIQYEVLNSQYEIELRKILLEEAMLLGNGEKHKVRIILECSEGLRMVETTVWDTSDSHIELKGGIDIPISCIREVLI
ncbi:MAG: hypothetical protein IPO83_17685 [Chitinophagaceae bacterium]|nr:hypothetical protein [Chitinophagaceae bacterium]